jgi:hypothetical protein
MIWSVFHPVRRAIFVPNSLFAWLIWAFFYNDDDGEVGDHYWNPSQQDTRWIRIKWWLRNPAHNFCFYVLGCAAEYQERRGRWPADVFAPDGWNFAVTRVEQTDIRSALIRLGVSLVALAISVAVSYLPPIGPLPALALLIVSCLLACRITRWMPFVSYQGIHIKAYIGWRERGNFGLKLNLKGL